MYVPCVSKHHAFRLNRVTLSRLKMPGFEPNAHCTWIKVSFVVSSHLQVILKVAQNFEKKNGEVVLAHWVNLKAETPF